MTLNLIYFKHKNYRETVEFCKILAQRSSIIFSAIFYLKLTIYHMKSFLLMRKLLEVTIRMI